MASRRDLTLDIDRGPSGPKIGAFFDVDRTLLAGFSAAAFLKDKAFSRDFSFAGSVRAAAGAIRFGLKQTSFPTFLEESSGYLVGMTEAELGAEGERIFGEQLVTSIYPESRSLVEAHQRRGHTVGIISSATHFQVDALARELGIEQVVCTELEVEKGEFTGKVVRPACWQEGKAEGARTLAEAHDLDLSRSYFYTDSHDDLPLLDIVGNPRLVNPDRQLSEIGARRGWPVYRFTSRGQPTAREIAGLVSALGSLGPAALVGLPAALGSGNLRRGVDLMLSTYADLSTAVTGVELQVEGEEHLWSHRPAVFIYNHQSGLDALLMARLLRRDVVGVAKKELETMPIVGPLLKMAGTVFVDRTSHSQAVKAMEPAVEATRRGLSILIAPEGTRSTSKKLSPFKKGAFHMAMAAGVPIVPIVVKNAGDALPKNGRVIRPATIEVVVHPPIPTDDWKQDDLSERIAEVRRLFEGTLASD